MKYYTLDQAVKKCEKEQRPYTEFDKAGITPFWRGLKNAVRMFYGYNPKVYYFPDNYKPKDDRVMF